MLIAVKFVDGSETNLEGLLLPFGGPINGADLYGERFTKATDFCLSWSKGGDLPLLFHHGLDPAVETEVVGRIKSIEMKDDGGWMQAQLDASAKYFESIKELVKGGKLFLSSGAMAHLVKVNSKSGEIERWPVVEGSLTPTPANLLARVELTVADKHYKSAGLALPDAAMAAADDSLKAVSMARMKEMAAEMDMEMSEDEMAAMMEGAADMSEADMKKRLAQHKASKSAPPLRMASWEDIRHECDAMLSARMAEANMLMSPNMGGYCYVEETYSDHVICCVCQNEQERHYSVPFELDDDGHVKAMGQPMEMEQEWKPKESAGMPMGNMPMAMHAEMTRSYAASLAERTKDLSQRRLKEGRMISDANRKRLMACMDQMSAAMKEMQTLMDSSAPQPAKAAALRRQADFHHLTLWAAATMRPELRG